MKILLIYNQMKIGGIETLILRMTSWFIKNNIEVNLMLLKEGGKLYQCIPSQVNIKEYSKRHNFIKYLFLNPSKIKEDPYFSNIDYIYAMYGEGLLIALSLNQILSKNIKIFVGIHHPKDYQDYANRCSRKVFNKLNDQQKFFMNYDCLHEHEKILNRKINGTVWPLPLKINDNIDENRQYIKYKIVSIGNLVSFKTYNIYMIDIVKQLREKGYDVTYEIYGEGILKDRMISKINEYNLANYIKINNQIPYEQLKDKIKDAHVFVGIGTSMIEAASIGVPSIAGLPYDNGPYAYGYSYELPLYNVGEIVPSLEKISVLSLIENVFDLNQEDYKKMALQTFNATKCFDEENLMNDFLNKIKTFNSRTIKHIKYYLLCHLVFLFRIILIKKAKYYLKKLFIF